jgi:hypothetical protein
MQNPESPGIVEASLPCVESTLSSFNIKGVPNTSTLHKVIPLQTTPFLIPTIFGIPYICSKMSHAGHKPKCDAGHRGQI